MKFAIHPFARRMPGGTNVPLAEADVLYDKLVELEDIIPYLPQTDVVVIIGANDTVIPSARDGPGSPIAGTPIIEADRVRSVIYYQARHERGLRRRR